MLAAALAPLLLLQVQAAPRTGPGDTAGYWQQDVRYTIRAALDEPSGVLGAAGRIVYRNNSPDTLRVFYLHLYLNAFRPGSRWAESERREGIGRFGDLPEPYNGFERLGRVTIDGAGAAPQYPFAPDSTVAGFDLRRPLAPGESLLVDLAWQSRPSAIPRRQGRAGRRFDFAQWYPKVAVYDRLGWQARPLYMAGEFYGEYATYDVSLDLAADQVVGATGVPAEGDPGWSAARAGPDVPVTLQADWYGERAGAGVLAAFGPAAAGRKRVRFHAEQVHDFAWTVNPAYVYEEGRFGSTVLRTLYLPEDRATWGGGLVIARMARLLAWMDTVFGSYPWPHFTAVHRIEGGGTEFPMVVMNGGAGEGLIFHEGGHEYTYGILGNNEWKDGWLDEGFTTFQTAWNFQRRGMGVPSLSTQQLVLGLDLDGWSEPIATPAELFSEFGIYSRMIYTKGQLFFEMLRYVVGEETFGRGLREYYARWKLRHVDEHALRRAMEDVSGQDLAWFFAEWLHGTPLVDYAVRDVRRTRADSGWVTRIEIERRADGVMPVDIAVPLDDTTLVVRARGIARREVVEVATASRPGRIELDPARQTMDWNYLNNREGARRPFGGVMAVGREEHRLGWSATTPARRDRRVVNWLPLAWFNDVGGVTVGFQSRANYLGRFELNTTQFTWPTGLADAVATGAGARWRPDWLVSLRNPVAGRAPRRQTEMASWWIEGRAGGRLAVEADRRPSFDAAVRRSAGADLTLMTVTDARFLDRTRWDAIHTIEFRAWASHAGLPEASRSLARAEVAVGQSFRREPVTPEAWAGPGPAPVYGWSLRGSTYARGLVETRRTVRNGRIEARFRTVAAGALGGTAVPLQRRIFLAGADPYATFANPFLRSRGALFARDGVHYQAPGGAGLRGYAAAASATWVVALNAEAGLRLLDRPQRRFVSALTAAAFADVALLDRAALGRAAAADAGVGLRAAHRIGPTRFVTRVDLPLVVTRPAAAVAGASGEGVFKFRWVWSLEEAF